MMKMAIMTIMMNVMFSSPETNKNLLFVLKPRERVVGLVNKHIKG